MAVVNRYALLEAKPISPMAPAKFNGPGGVSYGLAEAGYDIRIAQDVILHPLRRFRLASTVEHFDMPQNLVAIVHDKSTWIRRGLSVFNTVIEPGWRGYLTLELCYHGWGVLRVPAGAGIAQAIFHELARPADYGRGKYQNQPDRPVAAISTKGPLTHDQARSHPEDAGFRHVYPRSENDRDGASPHRQRENLSRLGFLLAWRDRRMGLPPF